MSEEVSDVGQPALSADPGWTAVPNSVARSNLSMSAKVVYMSLSSRVNCGDGNWPSHALLAKESSCSTATVKRALNELRDAGVVEWRKRASKDHGGQTTNDYRLIVSPPFKTDPTQ